MGGEKLGNWWEIFWPQIKNVFNICYICQILPGEFYFDLYSLVIFLQFKLIIFEIDVCMYVSISNWHIQVDINVNFIGFEIQCSFMNVCTYILR